MGANLRALSAELIQAGIKDGQDLKHASHYNNYALFGTPLRQMYGKNMHRLREIRKQYSTILIRRARRSRYLQWRNTRRYQDWKREKRTPLRARDL